MQVRFHGFKLKVGAVSLSDFFDKFLPQLRDEEFEYRKEARLVYVADGGEFFVGLLLTARDQRRFCELNSAKTKGATSDSETGGGTTFKVKVRRLVGNNRLVDFNFFIVKKKTGAGLFQHYRGSCGIYQFGYLLRGLYGQLNNNQRDLQIKSVENRPGKTKAIKEIREKYKHALDFTPILKLDDFAALVDDMRRIQNISFSLETLSTTEPWFTPVAANISNERHTFTFSKLGPLGKIKRAVKGAVLGGKYDNISVHGEDGKNTPITYHLLNNIESFDQVDFDQVTEDAALDVTNIENSPVVLRMMDIASKHSAYLK